MTRHDRTPLAGYGVGEPDPTYDPMYDQAPGTLVQLGTADGRDLADLAVSHPPRTMAPELALMLAAVLLAAAEQVSAEKLAAFGVASREGLQIHQLAMAFRGDDNGLAGDVFEWSLLLALNSGDPSVSGLMADALQMSGVHVAQPRAVLVAAEPNRLVSYSPELPAGAALATGRRGRPPHISNLIQGATTHNWKADLLLGGAGGLWVTASLKSNPRDLRKSLLAAATTPHPPRIGVTASRAPGVTLDEKSGAVIVEVPAHGPTMALAKLVLGDVLKAFGRHLTVPGTPLLQDITGIDLQLHRWRQQTVAYAVDVLLQWAGDAGGMYVTPSTSTGADVPDAYGALVAVNTIIGGDRWDGLGQEPIRGMDARIRYGDFEPID